MQVIGQKLWYSLLNYNNYSSMYWIPISMSADQTPAAGKNNVMEENSNSSSAFLPSMRGFKLASLNIASLPRHIDELRVLLSDNPLDILSINETRLNDSVSDGEVYIPGYDIFAAIVNITVDSVGEFASMFDLI